MRKLLRLWRRSRKLIFVSTESREGKRLLPHTQFFVAIIVAVLVKSGSIVLNKKEIWGSLREFPLDLQTVSELPAVIG